MNAQYTPGRLKVQHPHAGERGWEIAFEPGVEQVCQDITEANARRLVACWNACDGIETYQLELMTGDLAIKEQITASGKAKRTPTLRAVAYRRQRDELLAALKGVLAVASVRIDDPRIEQWDAARRAIAKVEGGAT